MNRAFAATLLAAILAGCGAAASPAATSPQPSAAASAPAPAMSAKPATKPGAQTVTYCTDDGKPQAMDISLPTPRPSTPAPAAIYVHGGGWEHGDRRGGAYLDSVRTQLLAKGFVVASIDYRLAPENKWPAQIVDAKCAVRYLRANAKSYGIDPARIGVWGGSAGGHLVSLMGTADASAGFDVGEWSSESSRVAAVVDLFGPADLTVGTWGDHATQVITEVFGGAPGTITDMLANASPVTWISRDDPPFLILQGDHDDTVPAAQSQEFATKLQAAGVPATLVLVKDGPHGLANPKEQPSPDQLTATIVDFFVRTLAAR